MSCLDVASLASWALTIRYLNVESTRRMPGDLLPGEVALLITEITAKLPASTVLSAVCFL